MRLRVPVRKGSPPYLVIGLVGLALVGGLFLLSRSGKKPEPPPAPSVAPAAAPTGPARPPTLEERLPKLPEARLREIYAEAAKAEKDARAKALAELPDPPGTGNLDKDAIANRPVRIKRDSLTTRHFSAAKRDLAAKHRITADELDAVVDHGAIKVW